MGEKRVVYDRCGAEYGIGDFPLCHGNPSEHGVWVGAEKPCEEFYDEMVSTDGETFTSNRAWVQYLDKNHIVPRKNNQAIRGGSLFFDMGKRR